MAQEHSSVPLVCGQWLAGFVHRAAATLSHSRPLALSPADEDGCGMAGRFAGGAIIRYQDLAWRWIGDTAQ